MGWLTAVGLGLAVATVIAYLVMLFVIVDFTYRTWIFDIAVSLGGVVAAVGWILGGSGALAAAAGVVAVGWFVLTRRELAIRGSERLRLRPGDPFPGLRVVRTDHTEVTERDLVAAAPTLLVLYRGWWCPSHKAQLDELVEAHDQLADAGLSVFAGSVDGADESVPVQDRVGESITILCGVPVEFLDAIGVRDSRGAPWYDRLIFGAKQQEIAMPAAFVIDGTGTVRYAHRSTRVDQRADPRRIIASAERPHGPF
ncbi:MAG TPA: redoxin domain-containing protein [Acidimicrobiia bacterium]|nr:redoxin domain-containing protein [Acidimicrobiia bacterium]